MGAMTACTGEASDKHSSKEIKFNSNRNLSSSGSPNKKQNKIKTRSNSQNFGLFKQKHNPYDFELFKFENEKNPSNYIPKSTYIKKNTNNYGYDISNKVKRYNKGLKQVNKQDDECDIIECEDEFECSQNMFDLIKNVDVANCKNSKRLNYFYEDNKSIKKESDINNNNNEILNDSYINKDLNMELSVSKNKLSGNTNSEVAVEKQNDNDNLKIINSNNMSNKLNRNKNNLKSNDTLEIDCFGNKNLNLDDYEDHNTNNNSNFDKIKEIKQDDQLLIKEKIKKIHINHNNNLYKNHSNFQNCKIDNNINININNNLNNISCINNNSELNNGNYIDVSSNTTYFLSVEKSHRRPITNITEKKSFEENNITYNNDTNNIYRNSLGINKYKWKLLPKNKYNSQISKSFSNNQSLSINSENQKNSRLITQVSNTNNLNNNDNKTDINTEKMYDENNMVLTEFEKHKKEQDKKIQQLQDKVKSLYKIINKEKSKGKETKNNKKISKLKEFMSIGHSNKNEKKLKLIKDESIQYKNALVDMNFVESQKDYKIKQLEEQLENVKKNNKINKSLLMQKNRQIKNLLLSKNKQDLLLKKYELLNEINYNNKSTKGEKKIKYFKDIDEDNIDNNLMGHRTSVSVSMKPSDSLGKVTMNKNENHKTMKNPFNMNNCINKYKNSDISKNKSKNKIKNKKASIDNKVKNKSVNNITRSKNQKKQIYKKHITNYTEAFHSYKDKNNKSDNNSNCKNNTNSIYHKSTINEKNINYNNYCNSLYSKSKNKYSNKINLNRIKIYKFNKGQIMPNNITNQLYNKKITKNIKKDNYIKTNEKPCKKAFSFKKSKKLQKNNEQDLKEMYLKAGKIDREYNENDCENEKDNKNDNINLVLNKINEERNIKNNEIKIYPYNKVLYRNNKNNNILNSNNNTTITNNITNFSMSPIILSGNYKFENLSADERLNLSENYNYSLHSFNPFLKSAPNDENEKEKNDANILLKKIWKEEFERFEEMFKNKNSQKEDNQLNESYKNENVTENESVKNNNLWKLIFGMKNELIEINVNKDDYMFDVKNIFLNKFFEKKMYGDNEKKYITQNILFLNKDGIINILKKVHENNLKNNDIITTVLKDVTKC